MAGSLSLTDAVQVFPCASCGQTINTSMQTCPFCSAPIDHASAELAAAATAKISQACSDASYLKVMGWAVLSFFGIMFVPFLSLIGSMGLWFLRFAIPFMVIRWWIRYGAIKTTDRDFSNARGIAIFMSAVAVLVFCSIAFSLRS